MEQRKHWWNGKWGRLARRDVFLRVDADRWHVEQRAGGAEGISRFYEYGSADEAEDTVRALLDGPDTWRELSPARPAAGPSRTAEWAGAADSAGALRPPPWLRLPVAVLLFTVMTLRHIDATQSSRSPAHRLEPLPLPHRRAGQATRASEAATPASDGV